MAPRGSRPIVGARLQRQDLFAFAAVSTHDGVMDSLVLPWANAETMPVFLAEMARRHAVEFIMMVMDQTGWHIAGHLDVPQNMRLEFPPPYSLELNPVEHLSKVPCQTGLRTRCSKNWRPYTTRWRKDSLLSKHISKEPSQ